MFRRILMVFALFGVCSLQTSHATIRAVPGVYATIQQALTAASGKDTILVNGGTYTGSLHFGVKSTLTLMAVSGTRPLIQYNGTDFISLHSYQRSEALVVHTRYTDETPIIRGFEFNGVSATQDTLNQILYGTFKLYDCVFHSTRNRNVGMEGGDNPYLVVEGCEFYDSHKGLYIYGKDALIRNNSIHDCSSKLGWESPMGLSLGGGSQGTSGMIIENNHIYNCWDTQNNVGYGIMQQYNYDCILRNNLIRNNGIGVIYSNAGLSVRQQYLNNTIINNHQEGMKIPGNANWILTNNIILYNGLSNTSLYADVSAAIVGKKGKDITYNNIGRYNDNLNTTFADTIFLVGNITTSPLFADTSDLVNGCYLLVHSPCIDAGNPGIRDADSSRSDMGAYGGPRGAMKAPSWLRNFGPITQVAGAPDQLSWTAYPYPAGFQSYRVYLDKTTTEMHYQPSAITQIDAITTSATNTKTYAQNAGASWYRISAVNDSTGYLLGGGYSEADTLAPVLEKAYYFCNGTTDPADDILRLVFSEGLNPASVNFNAPWEDIEVLGVGDLTSATIISANEFIIKMGPSSTMFAHNRSWLRIKASRNVADFYGNKAVTLYDSIPVITSNVINTDNGNAYELIDQAVDFASPGDFIMVFDDGIYHEQVTVAIESLTVQADSLANPIVDAEGVRGTCFSVSANNVSIVGFTCIGATQAGIALSGSISGVRIINDTCRNTSNSGIRVESSVTSSEIRGVVCIGGVTGIDVAGALTQVTNSICYDNTNGISVNANNVEVRNNVVWHTSGTAINVTGTGSRTTNCITQGSIIGTQAYNTTSAAATVFKNAATHDFALAQTASEWSGGEHQENIGRYEGYVTRSGDGNNMRYHTINAAYAVASQGEVLTAYQGKYYESVQIQNGKGITLTNAPHTVPELHWSEWGILEDHAYYMVINHTTSADDFVLHGFLLDQGKINVPHNRYVWGNRRSGFIRLHGGRVTKCQFRHGSSAAQPVIHNTAIFIVDENTVVVDSCSFEDCGYLRIDNSTLVDLKRISHNTFHNGAMGVYVYNSRYTHLNHNYFGAGTSVELVKGGAYRFTNNVLFSADLVATTDSTLGNNWINNTIVNDVAGMQITGNRDTLINNIIWGYNGGGFALSASSDKVVAYYNLVSNTSVTSLHAKNWNLIGKNPLFADSATGDFYLAENSPAIDGGHLRIKDPDFGRSDIGAYGGAYAHTAAPAKLDSIYVRFGRFADTLTWSGAVPADFNHYALYAHATNPNFSPDASSRVMAITTHTTRTTIVNHSDGVVNSYKISVVDNATYGGGYTIYDTIPPAIALAEYHSQGTRDPSDDVLKLLLNEWATDVRMPQFDSSFVLYGEGDFSRALVHTGARINDDTLIITGMTGMAARNRSWIGLRAGVMEDYAGNVCKAGSVQVTTYNVTIDGAGAEYATIAAAEAAAAPSQIIRVLDNGLYVGNLVVDVPTLTITPDVDRYVVLDAEGSGSVIAVTSSNVLLNGLRVTRGSVYGIGGSGSGLTVTNCIAYHNTGDGFNLNTTGALYNSNAYNNANGAGVRFVGAGTCINVISSNNYLNYALDAATIHRNNFSYQGIVIDQNYTNLTTTNPAYLDTDPTSATFLILSSSSQCVNAGDSLVGIVDTDIRGRDRPIVSTWDVGAYETIYGGVWLDHFVVDRTPTSATAGTPIALTVTAYSQHGTVFTSYNQAATIVILSALIESLITYTGITDNGDGSGSIAAATFASGVAHLSINYEVAYDTVAVQVANIDGAYGTSGPLLWKGAALARVTIEGSVSGDTIPGVIAGVSLPENIMVRVFDVYGNPIREYTGGITFASSDGSASLPTGELFESADLGVRTINFTAFTFEQAGLQSLAVTTGAQRDSVMVQVGANPTLALLEVQGMPDTVRAGDAFPYDVVVTAYDTYGNIITQFGQQIGFSVTDAATQVLLPAEHVYAANDSGAYTFTRGSFRLITAGQHVLTVSSGTIKSAYTVHVVPGSFSALHIESAAGGAGDVVGDVTTSTQTAIPLFAATYDQYHNFRSDTTVVWVLHTGDLVPAAGHVLPVTALSYQFQSLVINTAGRIRAYLPSAVGVFDTTGVLNVVEDPTSIYILTDINGATTDAITNYTMTTDDTATFYAVGFNNALTNLGAFQSTWSSTQTSGNFLYGGSAPSMQVAPSVPGSGTLQIDWITFTHRTGTITVLPGALHHIAINRGSVTNVALADTNLTTDDALVAWCGAYDAKGNLISDTSVTWSVSGGLVLSDLAVTNPSKSITYNGTVAPVSGFLIASYNGGAFKDSIQIDLGYGMVSHLVIRDADSTTGTEIGAFEMVAGRDTSLYITAYDADNNFIPGIAGTWTSNEVVPAFSYSSTGSIAGFSFAPITAGQGYIIASYPGAVADTTGLITIVSTPNWLEITSTPALVTAGDPFTEVTVVASMDLSGSGAGPFIPLTYNTVDHESTEVVWLVSAANNTVSPYGQTYAIPGNEQSFPIDSTNMVGDFVFVHAVSHQIQACIVNPITGDTIARSAWSDPIAVHPSGATNIELRSGSAEPYSWIDSLALSTDGLVHLHAGLYDSLGNFVSNGAVSWSADSTLVPTVPVGPDSSLQHQFTEVAEGYLMVHAGGYVSDRVYVTMTSGVAVRFDMAIEVDEYTSPGGVSATEVRSDSTFRVIVTALDAGGNRAQQYTMGALMWRWIEGLPEILVGAELPQDSLYPFIAGEAIIDNFRLLEKGEIALQINDKDSVLWDTLRITVYDASAPLMDSASTRDYNGDGYIDGFYVTYNESLMTDTTWLVQQCGASHIMVGDSGIWVVGATGFTVEGGINSVVIDSVYIFSGKPAVSLYGHNLASGSIGLDGSRDSVDTDNTPHIRYSNGGCIFDLSRNEGLSYRILSTDGAPPVIAKADYAYGDPAGRAAGDLLILTFSEPVDNNSWLAHRAYPDTVFTLISASGASAEFGNLSTVRNFDNSSMVEVVMGDDAVAIDPGIDRVKLVPGVMADIHGNVVQQNMSQLIHFPRGSKLLGEVSPAPNPLRQTTTVGNGFRNPSQQRQTTAGSFIKYTLNRPAKVQFAIFTLSGKAVLKAYASSQEFGGHEGVNVFYWNGTNDKGRLIESGSYLLRISATTNDGRDDMITVKLGVLK